MGPFETEYKKFWPKLDDADSAAVKLYPDHREFVFEQLLKIKRNIGEYKLSQNPEYNPNVPLVTKTSPLFFLFIVIAVASMLLITFVR